MLLSLLIIAIAMALFSVKLIFKKNGKFSSQHVHDNPGLRKMGIHCVVDQDRERVKPIRLIRNMNELNLPGVRN